MVLKNEANIYTNIYDKHDYDDLFLSASTGPRYVWKNGDVWLASIYSYRWYGWKDYNKQYGGKLNLNYDFTRKMSANFLLKITDNIYDEYGNWMDGQTYLTNIRTIYYLDTTKYDKTGKHNTQPITSWHTYPVCQRPSFGVPAKSAVACKTSP